ncbi:MAG: hypothetical protein NXH97_03930 [Rhodobacteraceae bacterium]|nr:hypothetical protein [Paracoccaceae bacterium]
MEHGLESGNALNDLLATLQDPSTHTETKDGSKLGLSWFITKHSPPESNAYDLVWKNGGIPGFSSFICCSRGKKPGTNPSEHGCFVLTNSEGDGTDDIAVELIALMRRKAELA